SRNRASHRQALGGGRGHALPHRGCRCHVPRACRAGHRRLHGQYQRGLGQRGHRSAARACRSGKPARRVPSTRSAAGECPQRGSFHPTSAPGRSVRIVTRHSFFFEAAIMASKGQLFAGCTVALVTPLRDGEVDRGALQRMVDWQIDQGAAILSPAGTTGEAPTLTRIEHERVIATVVEQAAGRARVLAGTGSCSTAEAVRLTRFAAEAGADGALVVAPYYNRPTQEGLYAHFAHIADASRLPLVVYNVPSRTGCHLEPETIERLAHHDRIIAVKEASGSLDQASEILARTELTVLSGNDSLTLPMLAVGAEGVISVV